MIATYEVQFSRELYSDLHKDARGYRPRGAAYEAAMAMSDEDFDLHCAGLEQEMIEGERIEREAEERARVRFEALLAELESDHRIIRKDAFRWLLQGEWPDQSDDWYLHPQNVEHFLWKQGIGFREMPQYMELAR